ncbi:Glutamyl-tRNA(Gln) amidotransferase subunit A [Anatilimnocola aggregata]|uniref:Glutamyl-tRNA(Gln) amidotransferase subunit A n=1 Tax=Anatilimnocola aggregata TaxID=2528021 RepID=A0A517YC29_9BACT|nr:Asp-tRNA(Asn)/Glu-tRNA(Gln) amidotransferase subunit GatA [Anatilimnocola aggregata]QDU27806.1 Glutamyl-tRNA(Gln) amidotransferase subunit A [Anatilimnocola aggregata]
MSLLRSTAAELIQSLQTKKVSSVELTTTYLDQIKQQDARIQAFLHVDREAALKSAKAIDDKRAAGKEVGKLAGLPVAIKDVLCTQGVRTTCASKMLENFVPPYDATVITKLKQADAVLIGKTNMDEFAMGGSTENSAFHPTRNPWDTALVPGGSSGGAAACLAAGMAPLSIGTDTGGSIRQPAAFCGVSGLKPTYGRVSRYGLVAFASSLDQVGPMGHTAEDCAILLDVIAGHDAKDSTSANLAVPKYANSIAQPLAGLKLGIVKEHFGTGLNSEIAAAVQAAVQVYESLGAKVKEISLPHSKYGIATYYIIAPSEASSNLARYDGVHYGYRCEEKTMLAELAAEKASLESKNDKEGLRKLDNSLIRLYRKSRSEGFGPEVKRRIMLGTYTLSAGYYDAYYVKALKVRRLIRGDYDAAFKDVDFIVGPTTPSPAFKLGEKTDDPLAMYLEDLYTVTTNLAGVPGMSIPCGFTTSGLPIGLQMQSQPFDEERLLRAAHIYQQKTDWHNRRAPE